MEKHRLIAVALLLGVLQTGLIAAPPKRVRPPKWSKAVTDVFFADARDALVGERPEFKHQTKPSNSIAVKTEGDEQISSKMLWSKWIDPDTIESEIKQTSQLVSADAKSLATFRNGGYKRCRTHFSSLAVLFALAKQHDDDVRWNDSAAGMRELFSQAARNCKVSSPQSFDDAAKRRQDIEDLVRGSRPSIPKAPDKKLWNEIADRPALMQRMKIAAEDRLAKWVASSAEFNKYSDEIYHEAQWLSALGEIIHQENFEYWDDEEFVSFSNAMRDSARDIASAAEGSNYELARQAMGKVSAACTNCHEGYR